jgi:hypothetical protein
MEKGEFSITFVARSLFMGLTGIDGVIDWHVSM